MKTPLTSLTVLALAAPALLGDRETSPVVRLLVPGFVVEELPVRLPNCNNLRFAPDGSLTALGYNGKIWRLRDTDGDGLEDTAAVWWDRVPFTVPVGMAWSTRGLIVSSSGKISLLRDTDGDGQADSEKIVVNDWPGKDVASGNVDATGVTLDAEGNLFFGLLTANYANPYRLKKAGQLTDAERDWLAKRGRNIPADPQAEVSLYDPLGQRGSVQKWHAKTGALETLATGVRVPYQFAFNQAGDLFMSDQEGETWCPNGNPLDELNHIRPGKHYGFPPRHERWLPGQVSEPPATSFGPQHQSTCGFVFNEPHAALRPDSGSPTPLPAGPAQGLFGPAWWAGNAIVAGESRGKLWRVPLKKTGPSYSGEPVLFACLSMLTTDVAISPAGDLYVSCHSGLPDWGTGPGGEGKLFRIRYADPAAPQPREVVPLSPTTVAVRFDRPVDARVAQANLAQPIRHGESVRAADHLEVLKPPYAVVRQQEAQPTGTIRVTGAALNRSGDTLTLTTEPHPARGHYALGLDGVKAPGAGGAGFTVHLDYDLRLARFPGWQPSAPAAEPALAKRDFRPGDYETGRGLFFSQQLLCATCHRIRGEGGGSGPDLSNLPAFDAASLLRELREPGTTINPDYVGTQLSLRDGRELVGFVRDHGNARLRVTSANGEETLVEPADVRARRPLGVSLMPPNLIANLNEKQVNDLLTFLLYEPPKRELADVLDRLGPLPRQAGPPLNIVLVASKQDHGPGQHDYPAWQKSWGALLAKAPAATVSEAWLWPDSAQLKTADVIVFYYWNHDWSDARYAELDAFQSRGGGLVILHSAAIEDRAPARLAKRIGLAAQPGTVQYRHMPFTLEITDPAHPVTANLPREIPFLDEPYWPMIGDLTQLHLLATARDIDGEDRPMMWTFEKQQGRVFASITGHYTWTLDDPLFRAIVLRGIAWAGRKDPAALLPALGAK
ncbi:MAG: ThuA domain-containing protein [Verrucomicrobia bacterium]|nr:ThuA domain-containing protein [Verrucomicrobiota bacterium]